MSVLEHPEGHGPPHCSIWSTYAVEDMMRNLGTVMHSCDQCMFGCVVTRGTVFCANRGCEGLNVSCTHSFHVGLDKSDGFGTAAPAAYPASLNSLLAYHFCNEFPKND